MLGKGMWKGLSKWVRNMKLFVSHENAHQRVTSAEEDFNTAEQSHFIQGFNFHGQLPMVNHVQKY